MGIKTEMDISQKIKDITESAMKKIDLILIGVEPCKAALQARRWFDIKRRKENGRR